MTGKRCACMECRIRAAIQGDKPTGDVDIVEAIGALGNVMAECLAHVPTSAAKRAAHDLLDARKKWQREPRVMVQQKPGGSA